MGSETQKRKVKSWARHQGSRVEAQEAPAPQPPASSLRPLAPFFALVLVALAAYANHFYNGFHFDDGYTILQNPYIRSLRNVPRFFTDAAWSSSIPELARYRPIVTTSLALDYWLSNGLRPLWFHISTFCWFLALLVFVFLLFRRILDGNLWIALFAAALFALHPANAEALNYIIARGEVYAALGVVASLWLFIAHPEQRNRLWYLLPVVVASLANPTTLIFPLILLAYVWLFEREQTPLVATLPAFAASAALGLLIWKMTPAGGPPLHALTQPWAALYYFRSFFLPVSLSADHGWDYSGGLRIAAGFLFVLALAAVAVYTAWRREMRPIAFGITWFLLGLLPVTRSTEVVSDYRMFFPFIGLALAAGWALKLAAGSGTDHRFLWSVKAVPLALLLVAAIGTHIRNDVWHTEESLWRDAANKNPQNGQALTLYGHALVQRGDYAGSLPYLKRAQDLRPNDADVITDLAVANGGVGNDSAATSLFERAEATAPNDPRPYYFYGRWLKEKGRLSDSRAQLGAALRLNPAYLEAHQLMGQLYGAQDEAANNNSPEALLNQSGEDCKNGRYTECLAEAAQALKLRPAWADAYGNISAAFLGLQDWDNGIQAAQQALRINPFHQAARNNLQWALEHKPKSK
jgi:tetratricopeptide (TPR) repeat protein